MNYCCIVRQKDFSRKVETSKVEFFYWNKLSNKAFLLNWQVFYSTLFSLTQDDSQHYGESTKVIFLESGLSAK